MSNAYKFYNPDGLYFISFSVVDWIDVFIRRKYKDIIIESLEYCKREKGLELFAYVIMTSHIHMITRARKGHSLAEILRDFKKFTSRKILKSIQENPEESRKEWIMRAFKNAGKTNSNNHIFQFWIQDNHPIELIKPEIARQKLDYIHNNPVEEGFVQYADDYLYSSAGNYAGKLSVLEVNLL